MIQTTAGTDAYLVLDGQIVELGCVTAIDPGQDSTEGLENDRIGCGLQYLPGRTSYGRGTLTLNVNPSETVDRLLYAATRSKTPFVLAVGWPDGESIPILEGGEALYSAERTWSVISGWFSDTYTPFVLNGILSASITFQRTSSVDWYPRQDVGGEYESWDERERWDMGELWT